MKKIWPWLLLLLLLIIFCVWTKKDSIKLHTATQIEATKSVPVLPKKMHYVDYTITQKDKEYILSGNFTNMQQQESLKETMIATGNILAINATHTDDTLLGDRAIVLTNEILPHFTKHYTNGKIVYADNKLSIYGDADSYEAQRKMQQLLSASTLPSQDNTNVLIVQKPIHFSITKEADNVAFTGTFNDENQINTLTSKLPASTSTNAKAVANHVDKGAVATTESILTFFMQKYKDGTIVYKDEVLTISGTVPTENDIDTIDQLLAKTAIKTVNHTTIDQEALAKEKAAEEARIKLEATRKAEEEARRLAEENAARAKMEALHKAEEAQRLAQEKLAAKEKITQLLQIENIEFEVNKATLTPGGKGTVDKLSRILKQYPDIRVEIAGHTDSDGSDTLNQKLSQSRVDTVKARLITRGVRAERLTARGYGESKPLVPNTSRENKQKNRRVEFNIQGE